MLVLPQRCDVYRMVSNQSGLGRSETAVIVNLRCLVVPISSFDKQIPYALESTHVIWVPNWTALLKEDELRVGRRSSIHDVVTPLTYVINGARQFVFGTIGRAFYASERE